MLAIVVLVGAACGCLIRVSPGATAAIALGAGSVAVACRRPWPRVVFGLACAGAAMTAYAAGEREVALHPPLEAWLSRIDLAESLLTLEGSLEGDAEIESSGSVRLRVAVSRARADHDWHDVRGHVQLHVNGAAAPSLAGRWTRGRAVVLPAVLREPQVTRNPGSPPVDWQALVRGYDYFGTVKSAWLVSVARGAWIDEASASVRRFVRERVVRLCGHAHGSSAAVITAILIGDRAGLDQDVQRRLQAAGTYHVIAISGGNIALVTGLVLIALRPLVRSYRVPALVTIAAACAYGAVVGDAPSVRRAVTAACLYLAAECVGFVIAPGQAIALVVILVLLWAPLTVVLPAAWLSFGATFGILLMASRLLVLARGEPSAPRSVLAHVWRAAASLFCATLAAELVLLPVSAALFSRVGLAGLLLNFVAIPAMAVAQIAGAAGVLLIDWWPLAARAAGALAIGGAELLVESSKLVDVAPWLSWRVPPASILCVACYYACLATLWFGWRHRRIRVPGVILGAASLVALLYAPALEWSRPAVGVLRLTMIDVGQGDAFLLQFPTGHTLLVDAGGASSGFDIGDRVVAPALWALGVRRLDWLLVTHPDLDHIGGAASVAAAFDVREIWEGVPVPRDPKRRSLRQVATALGAGWRQQQRGDHLEVGGISVDVMGPLLPDWERQKVRNDDSVVLRLRYGDVEMLLTGDVSAEIERTLLSSSVDDHDPPLRVLKVAHHGSRTSSSARFLQRYRPVAALVSVGRGNSFGHPAPEVIAGLRQVASHVFRSDRDAAVIVETDGHVVRAQTWEGQTWQAGVWSSAPGP
ncbi:MAG: DNA internalization-related competence protein ComEC/Rec2 [Vicinamibacterales bacterium]